MGARHSLGPAGTLPRSARRAGNPGKGSLPQIDLQKWIAHLFFDNAASPTVCAEAECGEVGLGRPPKPTTPATPTPSTGPTRARKDPDHTMPQTTTPRGTGSAGGGTPPETLREALGLLNDTRRFAPGQIVAWKPGMQNKKHPAYEEPAIVVDVLDPPVLDPCLKTGSAYFREPLDLVLGFLGEDGDFRLIHCDGRRFMPFGE